MSDDLLIRQIDVWPLDVPLNGTFATSQGRVDVAQNLFVRVQLKGGVEGFGEITPFPELAGADRQANQDAAENVAPELIGESVAQFRRLSSCLCQLAQELPATRCGLEMAILDAFCRAMGIPLWALWGGSEPHQQITDVTIPLLDLEQCARLGEHWYGKGFRIFKIKVGKNLAEDLQRVRLLADRYPEVRLVLDANQGFERQEAIEFIEALAAYHQRILLFEQPVAKEDLDALAHVHARVSVPVAADEAVETAEQAIRVVRAAAADLINLKITKSGILEALRIAEVSRAAGLGLMIGGMVETRLAMGCSLALAIALGGFRLLDLDTPLFLAEDPLVGGYQYEGPRMSVCPDPGLGMRPKKMP